MCTLYFCPRCLENRYSEKVEEANSAGNWGCPKCRKLCNCSNCRKKAGLQATGILANVARTAGFNSVSDLLERNPNAKAIAVPKTANGSSTPQHKKRKGKKSPEKNGDAELVDESALQNRPAPIPDLQNLAIHRNITVKSGRLPDWISQVKSEIAIPSDVNIRELTTILEFVSVFCCQASSGTSPLALRLPPLVAIASELLQPAVEDCTKSLCPILNDSPTAALHIKLLETVRHAWGVQGSVALNVWQPIMKAYYAALFSKDSSLLRAEQGPPAIAGELFFIRPPQDQAADEENEHENSFSALTGAATTVSKEFPCGGYWAVSPGLRVSMMHDLIHDVLNTWPVRHYIESSMGDAAAEEKERRTELADARKEARAAAIKQRDKEIALLIAGTDAKGLTLDQQHALLEEARQKAAAAANAETAAKLTALSNGLHHPPAVRAPCLGTDAQGAMYVQLQCASVLAGSMVPVLVVNDTQLGAVSDPKALVAALFPTGKCEGPLRHALMKAYKINDGCAVASSLRLKQRAQNRKTKDDHEPSPPESAGKKIQGKKNKPKPF